MEEISYKLPGFEGPLDLLLHLVQKHKLDIVDISIAELLAQYMATIEDWKEQNLDIAAEFLQMAARLVQIKSAMLLPKHDEGEVLREELVGLLIEYKLCRHMAAKLEKVFIGNDIYDREPAEIEADNTYRLIHAPAALIDAYLAAAGRGKRKLPPPASSFSGIVERVVVPVSSKITHILKYVYTGKNIEYNELFKSANSRSELVATFLAVLELIRDMRIEVNTRNGRAIVEVSKGAAAQKLSEITDQYENDERFSDWDMPVSAEVY